MLVRPVVVPAMTGFFIDTHMIVSAPFFVNRKNSRVDKFLSFYKIFTWQNKARKAGGADGRQQDRCHSDKYAAQTKNGSYSGWRHSKMV